jgi:radical SAM superfamily enzyme YgiQ (UPF0313 family)
MFHVKHRSAHILLLNPWITDFAAYNFWIKPLGLLRIGNLLRRHGFRISLIDCQDYSMKTKYYGDGQFYKTKIEKPVPVKSIPKNYSQYGIPEEMVLKRLSLPEEPDLICVSSGMTYWYPGVFKVIEITKKLFKNVPVVLGGIYSTLCYEHAKTYSGADIVFEGGGQVEILRLISDLTNFEPRTPVGNGLEPCLPDKQAFRTYPAFDLYSQLDYVCISTSSGCPFKCTYCASPFLTKNFSKRDPLRVVEEIEYWTTNFHTNNIAFYDDALLIDPSKHFIPMMKEVTKRRIRCNFHAPNALHIREIDEEVASLLFRGGFKTIRLGLETSNEATQLETGAKVDNQAFKRAIEHVKRAGYPGQEIGVYVMVGLPGQRVGEVEETIAFVKEAGVKPVLVEYSPIPHTALFEKAKKMSRFDLENEPLYHNNSILPCQWEGFTMTDYRRLKEELRSEK